MRLRAWSGLAVAYKLGLAACAFALPVIFVIWSLVSVQSIAVRFAEPEVAGARYLGALAAIQQQAALLALSGADSAPALAETLAALQPQDGARLDCAAEAAAAIAALRAPGGLATARARLRDLIVRIGDRSNLILDNVLGTYYLTDVVLNRLPDMLDSVADLTRTGHLAAGDVNGRSQLLVGIGGLTADLDGMNASMAAAEAAPGGAALKAALDGEYLAVRRETGLVLDDLRAGRVRDGQGAASASHLGVFAGHAAAFLEAELAARVAALRATQAWTLSVTAMLFVLASLGMMGAVRLGVTGKLHRLKEATLRLAQGDLDETLPAAFGADELGAMMGALTTFQTQGRERLRLEAAAAAGRARQEREYAARGGYTKTFGENIAGVLDTLTASAAAMRQSAQHMADAAEQTRSSTKATAEGAEESGRNLTAVAAATEQLTVSADEIARQIARVAEAAQLAVARVQDTGRTVAGLNEAAGEIGTVLALISSIAGQTNLLALNATIEAARAGEAGSGFAVVASEVKQLAADTARATAQIRDRVGAIQAATSEAAASVAAVSEAIGSMDAVAAVISAAVVEQGGATREIVASVQAVTCQNDGASHAMHEVSDVARNASSASQAVLDTAEELGRTSGTLRTEVEGFLATLAAPHDERRQWQRLPGKGVRVAVKLPDGRTITAGLNDISQSGASLTCREKLKPGDCVAITLPGNTGQVTARLVRAGDGIAAIAFRTDTESFNRVSDALNMLAAA